MITAIVLAVVVFAILAVWSLCRASARGDQEMRAAWLRELERSELENEPWEHA